MTALAYDVIARARSAGLKLATAESCTAGLISAALTEVPGSSAVLERGFVTYSNAAKTEMLGVAPDLIAAHGAVSEEVAAAMAAGALARSAADIAVAVTGVAGPGGSERKAEGMVCFARAGTGGAVTGTVQFGALGRTPVRVASVEHALRLVLAALPG
jgi:nicotinamide-nucleotide amidase